MTPEMLAELIFHIDAMTSAFIGMTMALIFAVTWKG